MWLVLSVVGLGFIGSPVVEVWLFVLSAQVWFPRIRTVDCARC